MSGTEEVETVRLRALMGNQIMLLLVDSGSTHTFVNKAFVDRNHCTTENIPVVSVRIANGEIMNCSTRVPKLTWWIQGVTFETGMRILELRAYDAILGMDWLEQFSPMDCHWANKTMTFDYEGRRDCLQGVLPRHSLELSEVSMDQLYKWYKGNDVWAFAIVQPHSDAEPANTSEQPAEAIQKLLDQYCDVFAEPHTLLPHRQYDHAITLQAGATPVNSRPYRYSPLQKDEIERQVTEMLTAGLMQPSMSPFASPVLLVQKKDGGWRFCIDYRRLNTLTIKNKFPLPVIDELLDELAGTKFFSNLDLRAGYHQIRMRPEDEEKTTFKTHHGHFQFRVMPFGLSNAPTMFQCLMNSVFAPYIRKFVIVFLDVILIYSRNILEHMTHLQLVFDTLRCNTLYAKLSKCSFARESIAYLGHIISRDRVATDPDKTSVMHNWPRPTTVTELRGFLGLTGYYRKFVRHYGIIAKPLTNLLKKKGFEWTPLASQAFAHLKQAMVSAPVLALPDFDLPFAIEIDACDTGVGAVLMQNGHPIAYLSKALGVNNQKLSIYEKEFFAVMMAIDRWRAYL